jgi:hypothetical protein
MHRGRFTARLRFGVASIAALVALTSLAMFAGAATAGNGPGPQVGWDPQNTNIPYLAWRGEQVRLVKCLDLVGDLSVAQLNGDYVGRFMIEDWSGDPFQRPQMVDNDEYVHWFEGTGEQAGRECFATDLVSLKAGIALVKLKIIEGFAGGRTVVEHQFQVAWMNILDTDVEDIGVTTNPARPIAANELQRIFLVGATSGTFTLSFGGETTGAIAYNATAAQVDAALEALGTIGAGDVTVTAGPFPNTYNITFTGALGGMNVAQITASGAGLNAGATVTVVTVAQGLLRQTEADLDTTDAASNQVQVRVRGWIPLGNNWDELGLGARLVMPDDWERWARSNLGARHGIGAAFARDPMTWDIHDELSWLGPGAHDHQTGGDCPGSSTTRDAVDNCLGGGETGPFSRFLHYFATALGTEDMTRFTVGPFDPLRQMTSYLPDGTLGPGDAPMPAAQIDFTLTGNAGALVPIDKHVVYSVNGDGTSGAHNLYAPFYARYIPATSAEDGRGIGTASGTSGGTGNNFQGYLLRGLYHYWDFAAAVFREPTTVGGLANCPDFAFDPALPRPVTASGHTFAAVYTDEHGEARIGFAPGIGFPFAGVAPDANLGCDLQGINPLGTGTISAIARYPFQPITAPDVAGDEVVNKTVTSLFNKSVSCVPKFPGNTTANFAFICTITAVGITGVGFQGETVCIASGGGVESMFPYDVVQTQVRVDDPRGALPPRLCLRLNANGQAQFEVLAKDNANVIVEFVQERLFRIFRWTALSSNPAVSGVQPVTTTSTQAPTQAEIISLGRNNNPTGGSNNAPAANKPAVAQKAKVVSARLKATAKGRSLIVRVNSTKAKSKIRIQLRNKKGKTLATAVRTVKTNRAVTVPNLRIAKGVATVRITAIS